MKLGKIIHLGIVVRDVEAAARIYEEKLGIGPWEFQSPSEFFATMQVNGGNGGLNIKTAMYKGDGYEIELVMPTGAGVYQEWLEKKGPGLHHIKFKTDSHYDEVVSTAEEISGRRPYLDVRWPDGRPMVAYADILEETGLLIEIAGNE